MDEKTKNELMAAVTGAVSEVNSKWEEYWAKVDALYADIIVISVLSTGVYNIDGTWKMTPDDQERATGKDDLFYVFNDESGTRLTWVGAGKIVTYNVPQGGTADDIVESEVATIDEVADQLVGDF